MHVALQGPVKQSKNMLKFQFHTGVKISAAFFPTLATNREEIQMKVQSS